MAAPNHSTVIIDDVARVTIRNEVRRAKRSATELGRVLGIEQGPAHRRLNSSTYQWRLADVVVIGDWLGIDLITEIMTMWKLVVQDGSALLGAVRADVG